MNVARRPLPRLQLRRRRAATSSGASAASRSRFVWHKDAALRRRRRGRPARRLLLRRLPARRRDGGALADHGRGQASSPSSGGPVLGICNGFQIALRGRPARRRAARATRSLHFECRDVHLRRRGRGRRRSRARIPAGRVLAHADRPRRGALRASPTSAAAREAKGASSSATSTPAAAQPTRPTPTARSPTSPASATRAATSSASCRTPSAPPSAPRRADGKMLFDVAASPEGGHRARMTRRASRSTDEARHASTASPPTSSQRMHDDPRPRADATPSSASSA